MGNNNGVHIKSIDDRMWDVVHIETTNGKERYLDSR